MWVWTHLSSPFDIIGNYIVLTRVKTGVRFQSFHFSGKTPLVIDLLKIDVTESLTSKEPGSYKSLAVIPSGPGLFDGSRFYFRNRNSHSWNFVSRYNRVRSRWWTFSISVIINWVEVIIKEICFTKGWRDWVSVVFVSLNSQWKFSCYKSSKTSWVFFNWISKVIKVVGVLFVDQSLYVSSKRFILSIWSWFLDCKALRLALSFFLHSAFTTESIQGMSVCPWKN